MIITISISFLSFVFESQIPYLKMFVDTKGVLQNNLLLDVADIIIEWIL